MKRLSSQAGIPLSLSKRVYLISLIKAGNDVLLNREYRCIIFCNYGEPIYKASFRTSLFAVLEGCIEGYESLYRVGFFYRDILINNLIVNEDDDNPSLPSFLIDLDFVVRV